MTFLIICIFIVGYGAIAMEHHVGINKAATSLLIGTVCWSLYLLDLPDLMPPDAVPDWFQHVAGEERPEAIPLHYAVDIQHLQQTGEIASILFFLIGAMTIVEIIDVHEGFALVTRRIRTRSKRKLFWTVGLLTFFLSAALDNLTTTIVMVSLLKKLIADQSLRWRFVGLVVIAANAGGAWTVIGDVTTTMLWIQHKIGSVEVMLELLAASVVCLIIPLMGMSWSMKGRIDQATHSRAEIPEHLQTWHQWLFLLLGLAGLLFVPGFKSVTHLPPYMGMMLVLGVLWFVSELVGRTFVEEVRTSTGVNALLSRIDMPSILFFLGILLAVGALSATGILHVAAAGLEKALPNRESVAVVIGLISSILDNVPLVAAGIEMYELPLNNDFWMLLAYCAGTGGSCLIIGSAAGVAAMGLDKISFVWYLRHIAGWALLGYLSGSAVLVLQQAY